MTHQAKTEGTNTASAGGNQRTHTYQVRPSIGGPPVLSATVDRQAGTITATTGDGRTITLDVTTARAIWVVIQEAVYQERSLRTAGPTLTLQ